MLVVAAAPPPQLSRYVSIKHFIGIQLQAAAVERWRQQAQAQHVKKRETVQVRSWGDTMYKTILLGSVVPILYIIVRTMTQILVYESISHPLNKNCLQPQEEEGEADSGNCNILLYFGLGLMCVGSVIAFVGGWWGRVNIYLDEDNSFKVISAAAGVTLVILSYFVSHQLFCLRSGGQARVNINTP